MGCGDTGTGHHWTRGVREVLSYWCCFWRASGSELHCWKLRVLPSSLFISSRWAFFSASMAAQGDNGKRNGGSGSASFMETTPGNCLVHCRFHLGRFPLFPFFTQSDPHVSTLQDHHAAEGTNTGHWGSSPPLLPALPTYKKVLVTSHPSTEIPFPSVSCPPHLHQRHRSEKHQSSCSEPHTKHPTVWLQVTGRTGF